MNEIVLSDGTKLSNDGKVLQDAPKKSDIIVKGRRLEELPKNGKVFAIIAGLELWGLPAVDIAEVLDIPHQQLQEMMSGDNYQGFRSDLIEGVLNAETDNIRHIFMSNAAGAARGITSMIDSQIPEVRMFAMKETLDRAGFRPADVVEHRHRMENALQIVHITDDEKKIEVDIGH